MPLFNEVADNKSEISIKPSETEDIKADYASTGLSLRRHPMALVRNHPEVIKCITAEALVGCRSGQVIEVIGLVTCRQRPGTKSGVTFLTLEDETGNMNVVVWANTATLYRKAFLSAQLLWVKGVIEMSEGVIHVVAGRLEDKTDLLQLNKLASRRFH